MQSAGEFEKTLGPLRRMVDGGNKDPEVLYLLGSALSATNEKDAAMWPLRRAMDDPDWLVRAGLQITRDAFHTGNNDIAIETAGRILEADPENVPALVLRARAKIETRQQLEGAVDDAERALEIDPDSEPARIARAVALLGLERVEEAAKALEEIESLAYESGPDQPDSARYCGARASFAKEKGDLELADERYTKCLEKYPGSDVLVSDAIRFYESQRKSDRVIEILQAALEEAPGVRDFRVGLALRLSALGRLDEAEKVLRDGTEAESPALAAGAWQDLAGFLIDHERYDEGVAAMRKVLERLDHPHPDLLFRYADALVAAGRYDEALELADKMTVAAHRNFVRGRVFFERGQYAEALKAMDAGFVDWPENAVARYYAARTAEKLGEYDRAVEDYRYSIRAAASQTDARLRLAKLHYAEGHYEDAVAILRHDLANNVPTPKMAELELEILARVVGQVAVPPHLAPVINRPDVWQRCVSAILRGLRVHGGSESALAFLDQTQIDLTDPANELLLRDKARLLIDAGRSDEASKLVQASVDAHPDLADFQAALGLVRLLTGNEAAKARGPFERALELDPEQPVALAGMARLADEGGDAARAVDLYLKADAADPRDDSALEAAIDVLVRDGQTQEAERQLERLLDREPYLGSAALRLVELRVARGAGDEARTRALARAAMRFGGKGPAAEKVLASADGH